MDDRTRGSIRVVGVACLVFGLVWMGFAIPFFLNQRHVLHQWNREEATVVESGVIAAHSKGLFQTHFAFDVHDGRQSGPVVVDGYRQSNSQEKIAAEAQRFRVGETQIVRVNPANASELRLDSEDPWCFFFLPIVLGSVGGVFLLVALVLFGVSSRR